MNLPPPLSWFAAAGIWVCQVIWSVFSTITGNVASLGWAWAVTYWFAVVAAWSVGGWGAQRLRRVRVGNDFIEFSPARDGGRAPWYGRTAALVIRTQVVGDAWMATAATIGGYGTFAVLLAVGFLWTWLSVLVAGWALSKAFEARRRARRLGRIP